jgi:DNA-binding cell septation regulator SpoVG
MVTIEAIKLIDGTGNLRAFVSIVIAGEIRIAGIRIMQLPGKSAWVAMPSREYESKGQRKWAPIIELLDEKLKNEVSDTVLQEFSEMTAASDTAKVPSTRRFK